MPDLTHSFATFRPETAPLFSDRDRLQAVPKEGCHYDVAPDVLGLKTQIVNSYFIGTPGERDWVLIDAGWPGCAPSFLKTAEERFGRNVPPQAILLTHGHFDHVGSLHGLLKIWDVPVYAHPLELPYLTGQASYPPPDPTAGGGAMTWSSFLYPKHPIDLGRRVQPLPEDGTVPGLPAWRWIQTPGHTNGHVSFFREDDGVLIAGDAFVTIKAESLIANITLTPEVHRPPAYFTPDWPAARASIERLATLNPSVAATGHGAPLYGRAMREDLWRLAMEFESRGLPAQGSRYRDIPVLIDGQTGLNRVPPLPVLPYVKLAGLLGLVGLAVFGWHAARKRD